VDGYGEGLSLYNRNGKVCGKIPNNTVVVVVDRSPKEKPSFSRIAEMTYVCQFDWISLPFARGWKNNSSKSSSTGQYDWPMVIETPRRYLGFLMGFKCEFWA
jgi:hypothetical protein